MVARDRLILNGLRQGSWLKRKSPTAMAVGPLVSISIVAGLGEILGQLFG